VALAANAVFSPIAQANWGNLRDRIRAHFDHVLMSKARSFLDVARFEESRFYDQLQILQRQSQEEPISLASVVVQFGQQLVTVVALCGLLVPLAAWIPVLLLATTLPQAIVALRLQKQIWDLTEDHSPHMRRMSYFSTLMLTDTYAKEVRLFNLSDFLMGQYWQAFRQMHQSMRGLRRRQALWSGGLALVGALGNGLAFAWVVWRAGSGILSAGDVLLFVQSLSLIQRSLFQLVAEMVFLYDALSFLIRLFAYLDTPLTLYLAAPPIAPPVPIRHGIRFDRVSFHYPDGRVALNTLSFSIHPGETVALVGENGTGKTTLVKLLTRLYDPSEGHIWVDAQDLRELDVQQWRAQFAVAFQDFGRYALTLAENIALGEAGAEAEQVRKVAAQAGLTELLLKLPQAEQTPLGKQFDGTELSGGEWQKLALARAFWRHQAQILILDEPTAALDPRAEAEIYEQFAQLARGKTTLLITHRLASTRMADRNLVLKGGNLIEMGSHQELVTQAGEYAHLWDLQSAHYNASRSSS
jgi:ATP-binding cassette subfamily B protein